MRTCKDTNSLQELQFYHLQIPVIAFVHKCLFVANQFAQEEIFKGTVLLLPPTHFS